MERKHGARGEKLQHKSCCCHVDVLLLMESFWVAFKVKPKGTTDLEAPGKPQAWAVP